jgi:hypothetical protein
LAEDHSHSQQEESADNPYLVMVLRPRRRDRRKITVVDRPIWNGTAIVAPGDYLLPILAAVLLGRSTLISFSVHGTKNSHPGFSWKLVWPLRDLQRSMMGRSRSELAASE